MNNTIKYLDKINSIKNRYSIPYIKEDMKEEHYVEIMYEELSIEMIKEIERLDENNQAYQQELCKLWDERDNAYRIINELEIWLEERLEKLDIYGYDDDVFNGIELALQKLKELKGSDIIDKRSNN